MSDYVLGGVTLEVLTPLIMPVAQPNEDTTLNWPTTALVTGTPVLCLNGAYWRVYRDPEMLEDGRTKVELRHPTRANQRETFAVPADQTGDVIWNTGQAYVAPEPEPPVVEVPPEEPNPGTIGDPPPVTPPVETPVEPTEPPAEG